MVKPHVATNGERTAELTERDRKALARAVEVLTQVKFADGGELGDIAHDMAADLSAFLGNNLPKDVAAAKQPKD